MYNVQLSSSALWQLIIDNADTFLTQTKEQISYHSSVKHDMCNCTFIFLSFWNVDYKKQWRVSSPPSFWLNRSYLYVVLTSRGNKHVVETRRDLYKRRHKRESFGLF